MTDDPLEYYIEDIHGRRWSAMKILSQLKAYLLHIGSERQDLLHIEWSNVKLATELGRNQGTENLFVFNLW